MNEILSQEEIQNDAIQYPMRAQDLALSIKDDESYRQAGEFLITIKGFRKKVEATFGPIVKKANETWKAALDLRKQADAPLDEAEHILKPALLDYEQEQSRKRYEEQERLIAEQRKKDEDAKIAEAAKVAESGDLKAAEAVLDAPLPEFLPPPPPPKAKIAGISYREVWKANCHDMKLLVAAVAQGRCARSSTKPARSSRPTSPS